MTRSTILASAILFLAAFCGTWIVMRGPPKFLTFAAVPERDSLEFKPIPEAASPTKKQLARAGTSNSKDLDRPVGTLPKESPNGPATAPSIASTKASKGSNVAAPIASSDETLISTSPLPMDGRQTEKAPAAPAVSKSGDLPRQLAETGVLDKLGHNISKPPMVSEEHLAVDLDERNLSMAEQNDSDRLAAFNKKRELAGADQSVVQPQKKRSFTIDDPMASRSSSRSQTQEVAASTPFEMDAIAENLPDDTALGSISCDSAPHDAISSVPSCTNESALANRSALFRRPRPDNCIRAEGVAVPPEIFDFSQPSTCEDTFDPCAEMEVYEGKLLYATQRPLVELGRPWYQLGQLSPSQLFLGRHNPVNQQFVVFGDLRTAAAANRSGADSSTLVAWQSNLFFDWKLTGTERFHFNITPLTEGTDNSRYLFDEDEYISELNADINFGFFEGDLGALAGGFSNKTLPFDLPIAIGVIPLVMQNGIWMEDAILGLAATIPARNSAWLDIANYDVTFFAGWDNLSSPVFGPDDNAAKVYGLAGWSEALNGYVEADYAFVEDRDSILDRSYHNLGLGYTRRWGRFISNSMRVIVNSGQSIAAGPNTADGVLLLCENSLITANPSTILPYVNFFAGFDRPQSVARQAAAGGILRNTGILFESDNLTGYPTLDASANDTFGAAIGLSLLPQDFSQQLVIETAFLGVMNGDPNRAAVADQRGVGVRYQLPLNNSVILRADGMYGSLADVDDISGVRFELRRKF